MPPDFASVAFADDASLAVWVTAYLRSLESTNPVLSLEAADHALSEYRLRWPHAQQGSLEGTLPSEPCPAGIEPANSSKLNSGPDLPERFYNGEARSIWSAAYCRALETSDVPTAYRTADAALHLYQWRWLTPKGEPEWLKQSAWDVLWDTASRLSAAR